LIAKEQMPNAKPEEAMNTNLHILMNWQKQGSDWKLLSRPSTKL
jgi:hypothetical protein